MNEIFEIVSQMQLSASLFPAVKKLRTALSDADLLYDPLQDDKNQKWMDDKMAAKSKGASTSSGKAWVELYFFYFLCQFTSSLLLKLTWCLFGTINSKINDTPKRWLLAYLQGTLDFSHSEFTWT